MAGPLAAAIFPRISLIFFRYMQPFLINRISRFVAEPVSEASTNVGWGLTAAYSLVYTDIAVSSLKCDIPENEILVKQMIVHGDGRMSKSFWT